MAIDLGDPVPLAVYITDDAGAAANATLVVATVTLPDATVVTPAVTNGATGVYTASYPTTQVGRHAVRWVATGTNACTYSDEFDVEAADMRFLMSLDEARKALSLPAGTNVKDEDLRGYVASVTPVVEDLTGPVLVATKVRTVDGGGTRVVLPHAVRSVTSVVENGVTLVSGTDYVADLVSGIITRGSTVARYPFLPGIQNVVITYTVGAPIIPESVTKAAGIILRQMWQADQQGYRPAFGQASNDTVTTPSGFLVPKRAMELLRPTPNMAGFA